jgi:hypothetical protein
MKFHGDYTFSSYPTFLGCSLVVRQMSLDKLSVPPQADVKKMKFHGDYTFSSYPTFLGCSLVVRQMSLDKLSVPPHCLKDTEVSEDLGVHHLLSPRAHMMKL